MFRIEVHQNVRRMISLFYGFGVWHRRDEETVGKRSFKLFCSLYHCLFPLSLAAGIMATDNQSERIFSIEVTVVTSVLQLKLWYIIWKREEILQQLNRICDYGIDDRQTFNAINGKLANFMKFVRVFLTTTYVCTAYVA